MLLRTTLAVLQLLSNNALQATITDLSVYLCDLHCSAVKVPGCLLSISNWHKARFCLFAPGFQYISNAGKLLQRPHITPQATAWSHAEALGLITILGEALVQEAVVASH